MINIQSYDPKFRIGAVDNVTNAVIYHHRYRLLKPGRAFKSVKEESENAYAPMEQPETGILVGDVATHKLR
jgi:hypothetical protein